ncbi:rod shape-determining protein MreB [Kribbella sp. VKM Ac-2571]|uniref:rod shape-determining protein n=1 Tax=Kribbella sp. VKM Ac-2571 TaxID=2512222 RepID=UPI0010ECA218|nr:rod shape-determining protein [Kribbella sp. VKM Ac-2571]TDO66441.1 rod shape-determining protein MreB [Kribbella sp. VKM Ac-2571]
MKPLLAGKSVRRDRSSGRNPTGLAIDLGSARTRAWTPGHGLLVDVPTMSAGTGKRPVRRGKIVDRSGAAALVGELLKSQVVAERRRTVVATIPLTSDEVHRGHLLAVLDALGPETILTIDSVKAAALGADVDMTEPLLVVDLGAQLTEVALLAGGNLCGARCLELGVRDPISSTQLVQDIVESMVQLMGDCGPQMVDALDRGVLLTGGGALRPQITYQLSTQLGATVQPAPAPHAAAVRGAALALQATHRHPGAF